MSPWKKRSKPVESDTPAKTAASGVTGLTQRLAGLRDFVRRHSLPAQPQRRLEYAEAISWFVTNRPQGNIEPRGGILRTPLPSGGIEIMLMFLDSTGQQVISGPDGKPCARRFIVDELDDELTEAFGGTPLLIIT